MTEALNLLTYNPTAVLSALQGGTYCVAAILAKRMGHSAFGYCYASSALLDFLLATSHLANVG